MATAALTVGVVLKQLQVESQQQSQTATAGDVSALTRIVLVPDASTSHHDRLAGSAWDWLQPLVEQASLKAEYYELQYEPEHKASEVWQALSNVGDALLMEFLKQEQEGQNTSSSTVLIGHGLGGIPAKKAVTRLSERLYDVNARRIWDNLMLIVNIGCPHPSLGNRDRWSRLDHVLRHARKYDSKALKAASEEAAIVANLCSKFREADIPCTVLTTYETQPTKLKHGHNVFKKENRVLIDRDFAATTAYSEMLIALDTEGRGLRLLNSTAAHTNDFKTQLSVALRESCHSRPPQDRTVVTTLLPNLFESTLSDGSHAGAAAQPTSSDPTGKATAGSLPHRPSSPGTTFGVGTRKPPRLPCHIYGHHPRNIGFHGRKDVLDDIDSCLLPTSRKHSLPASRPLKSFAVCGLGGMGKTQIALEYAFSRSHKFDAIFWIQADARTSIAEGFGTAATSLSIADTAEASDLAISYSIFLRWLTDEHSNASWLIIFDNADTMELVNDFWPSIGTGSVLITTRDPSALDYCLNCGVMLQPLSISAAAELFCDLVSRDPNASRRDDPRLLKLLERFGGIPLAIVQVASLIRRQSLTVAEFAGMLEQGIRETGLAKYQALQQDGGYHQSLFTVWAFESLDEKAQSLLNTMSALSPFNIQERILKAQIKISDSSRYPATELDYLSARSNLLKASLIIRNLDLEQVELHPLVQEVLQARMNEAQITEHAEMAIALVHKSWPSEGVKWGHETSHREQSGQIVPHALKLKSAYYARSIKLSPKIEVIWIELLKNTGWYLYERGEHKSALSIFQSALVIARKRSHDAPSMLADVLMSLAALGVHVSHPDEVLSYSREHLQLRQQVHDQSIGPPSLQTQYDLAMGYATMAMAYNHADQLEESIEQSKIALSLYRSFDLYRNWNTVPYFAVAHLGWSLWSIGWHDQAEKVMLEAVEADRIRNKGGSYGLGGILLPLGNVQTSLNKFDEACATHEAALEMFFAANGNNFKTSQARLKVADHYARLGRVDVAWQFYETVIDSFRSNPYYKPELARAKIKAARFRASQGDADLSRELLTQAQATLEEIGVNSKAMDLSDHELTKMVRMWSR